MPMAAIEVYMDRLEGLQGEMALILAETTVFPWMDSRDQRRVLSRWRSATGIKKIRPTVGQMSLIGIRVDYASKSG